MADERFEQQIAFCRELDKAKKILRRTSVIGHERRENDAEHAWHMAVMAVLLQEYANEEINLAKALRMILIHDVVEIDAGDTYAYDPNAKQTQKEREKKAADRLFRLLPEDQGQEMRALWEEFEAGETPEAAYARTIDNFQPMLLNDANEGIDWRENKVAASQVLARNKRTAIGSETIWEYMRTIIDRRVADGSLKNE